MGIRLDKIWLPPPECFYSASKLTRNFRRSTFLILGQIQIRGQLVFFIEMQQDGPQLSHSCACPKLSQSLEPTEEKPRKGFQQLGPKPWPQVSGQLFKPEVGSRDLGFFVKPSIVCLLLSQLLLLFRVTSEQASDTGERGKTSTIQE